MAANTLLIFGGVVALLVLIGVPLGVGFGTKNAQNGVITLAILLFAGAIVGVGYFFSKLPAGINSGSSIGVLSFAAGQGEMLTSVFVRFLPISLVWLGILLSALSANINFIIPSLMSIATIGFIAGLQTFLPNV